MRKQDLATWLNSMRHILAVNKLFKLALLEAFKKGAVQTKNSVVGFNI